MDFRSPSIKQIADFLLFLFQKRHLQPSTIEGYRTAIADKVGNVHINISNVRYYLDKTKDLRVGKELVFVSFRKNFQKDIVPATISSWIKQTIVLCYQLSDKQAQELHQVRAHDVRAFAASKAFQGGVPLF